MAPSSTSTVTAAPAEPGSVVDAAALAEAGVGAGPIGSPGVAPSSGPSGGPIPDPGTSGGTGTPVPTPTPTPTPGADSGGGGVTGSDGTTLPAGSIDSFLDILKTATTPDALEAQNIILRRIALQGDVIPSRVPPPRNITEIGGYLNLLTTLNEFDMRSQVLAGILGVAGPNPPLGWVGTGGGTPLTFTPLVNDRPAGPDQASLPVTVLVRSDLIGLLRQAIDALHAQGCVLPLRAGPLSLPPAGGLASVTLDPLDYIGRTLYLAPKSAMVDPETDPIAVVRPAGSSGPFSLALRSSGTPTPPVATADYDALKRPAGTPPVSLTGAPLVMLAAALAPTGFAPVSPLSDPLADTSDAWTRLVNSAGLAEGAALGDELRLLHAATEIASSALATKQTWRWDGTKFAQ